MANTIFKLRRSSVAGKSPNTSTLSIGELAINLTDRKLFSSDGTNIFETGSNLTSLSVFSDISIGNSSVNAVINSTSLTVKSIVANGGIGTANQVLTSNGTGIYWATSSGSSGASRTYSVTTVSGTQNTFSTPGNFVTGSTDVYLNGVHLSNAEYTEISSNTIQLTENAPTGAIVEIVAWSSINPTAASGSNTQVQFNDSGSVNASAAFTFNKSSNTLFVANTLGIGNSSPTVNFYVNGSAAGAVGSLIDGANIAIDMSTFNNFSVTLNGARNLDNPTNLVVGQSGVIWVSQNTTGGQTLSYGSYWKFPSNTAPTLTSTASAIDAIVYVVRTTTSITAQAILNVG